MKKIFKKIRGSGALWAILVIGLFIVFSGSAYYLGKKNSSSSVSSDKISPTQTQNNTQSGASPQVIGQATGGVKQGLSGLSHVEAKYSIAGLEGQTVKGSYGFDYNPSLFSVQLLPDQTLVTELLPNGGTLSHQISLFNNDPAAFSLQEFADSRRQQVCPSCSRIMGSLSIKNSPRFVGFENNQAEWIIVPSKPGFVIFYFQKPSVNIREILKSFEIIK